jgi:hypothetical protein
MPRIAEIKEIDGELWVRIPKPMFSENSSVTLYSAGEVHDLRQQAYEDAISAIRQIARDLSVLQ